MHGKQMHTCNAGKSEVKRGKNVEDDQEVRKLQLHITVNYQYCFKLSEGVV